MCAAYQFWTIHAELSLSTQSWAGSPGARSRSGVSSPFPCPGQRRKARPVFSVAAIMNEMHEKKGSLWGEIGYRLRVCPPSRSFLETVTAANQPSIWMGDLASRCEDAVVFCQSERLQSPLHCREIVQLSLCESAPVRWGHTEELRSSLLSLTLRRPWLLFLVFHFYFFILRSQLPCRDIWTEQIHLLNKGRLNHQAAHFTLKTDFSFIPLIGGTLVTWSQVQSLVIQIKVDVNYLRTNESENQFDRHHAQKKGGYESKAN